MEKILGDSEDFQGDFQENDGATTKGRKKKGKDEEELKKIMTGFGDDKNPNEKTAELLDEYMVDFLQNLISSAFKRSQRRDPNCNQLLKDDLLYFIQNDTKKYMRVAHIVKSYERWEKIKKNLNDPVDSLKVSQYNDATTE